jgi:hypothetical protein
MTDTTDLGVGDVALDLAQGRPVHVIGDPDLTVAAWNAQNNYDLLENYGNQRLEATGDDRVYDVVYCSNAKSEPSRSYTMPDSRLLRVETDAADGGRPVRQRVQRETLVTVFTVLQRNGHDVEVDMLTDELGYWSFGDGVVAEARELADVDATIGGDDA